MGGRPLLNRRLDGLGTTIFAEMSARWSALREVRLTVGAPPHGPSLACLFAASDVHPRVEPSGTMRFMTIPEPAVLR